MLQYFICHLVYDGVVLLKLKCYNLHDCFAYLDFFRSNFSGRAKFIIYQNEKKISQIDVITSKILKPLPFPLTLRFKKRRIKDKEKILSYYGF